MKTAILHIVEEPNLFIVDGDYRHLHDVAINSTDSSAETELCNLLYNEDGTDRHPAVTINEFVAALHAGANLIITYLL